MIRLCCSPDSDKFDVLITWLKDGGAEFPLLYMKRYSENNRGRTLRDSFVACRTSGV
jgi:hypothetical protein